VVIEAARKEQRCLVTLDLEFGNPLLYRAADYHGIAVLRLPTKPSYEAVEALCQDLDWRTNNGDREASLDRRGGQDSNLPRPRRGSAGAQPLRTLTIS